MFLRNLAYWMSALLYNGSITANFCGAFRFVATSFASGRGQTPISRKNVVTSTVNNLLLRLLITCFCGPLLSCLALLGSGLFCIRSRSSILRLIQNLWKAIVSGNYILDFLEF